MITRLLQEAIQSKLGKGKAIILMGARQVGKTTLLKMLFADKPDVLWMNGDELDIQSLFENISASRLKAIIGSKRIIIIDEAQRIPDIGLRLKLITDQIPEVQLIATGSSSFNLAGKINAQLTVRQWEYKMYPINFNAIARHTRLRKDKILIPHHLVFGYYPDVIY